MNFLSIDGALENIIFFIKIDNKTYSNTFQSNKYNYENLSNLLINFLNRRNVDLNEVENIFVNQGPGNFSGLRTTIAVAKGLCIAKKLKIFGYNTFFLAGSKFFDETFVLLIYRNKESFFVQEFEFNLKTNYLSKIISLNELKMYNDKKLVIVNQNLNKKNEFNSLNDFNNLHTTSIDYENILFLYNKNLVTKELIKPLYLS